MWGISKVLLRNSFVKSTFEKWLFFSYVSQKYWMTIVSYYMAESINMFPKVDNIFLLDTLTKIVSLKQL